MADLKKRRIFAKENNGYEPGIFSQRLSFHNLGL